MKFKGFQRNFIYYKFIFDKGFGLTNYFKYVLLLTGIYYRNDLINIVYLSIGYVILCFLVGYVWISRGFQNAENDVSNYFNPFVAHVKRKLKLSSKNKKFK